VVCTLSLNSLWRKGSGNVTRKGETLRMGYILDGRRDEEKGVKTICTFMTDLNI